MDPFGDPSFVILLEIICFVCALIICGLLSAAEKAITNVNRTHIRELAENGNERAKRLVEIFNKPSKFFSAVSVVIIFCAFLFSGIITINTSAVLSRIFIKQGIPYATKLAMVVLIIVISLLFLVFGILYPRKLALQHTEGVALKLSKYSLFFTKLCSPFVFVVNGLSNLILRATRQDAKIEDDTFSEDEVMSMLEVGQESGALKEEGKKMIDSIFAFDDKLAYEVMTPRTDVFSIDIQDETEEYIDELMELRYSRIPVYNDDSDNIIGILNIKDYLIKAREDGFENVDIEGILRKPFFVPETKNIDSLFFELQKTKQHIAILIDEYGGFSGIVTMEDLIEEVMGDIDDEYDKEEPVIEKINDTTFYIDGFMNLDDINEEIGIHLESENNETLGGLLIDILGEIPDEEDDDRVVKLDNYIFTIKSVKDRRIERVKLFISPEEKEKKEETEEKE